KERKQRSHHQHNCRQYGRQTQRRKRCITQIQHVRRRKRVRIHIVGGENIPDVGLKGQMPRLPQQSQQSRTRSQSHHRQSSRRDAEPSFAHARTTSAPFTSRNSICQQHQQWKVRRESVVLLVGRDGKKHQ